MSTLFLIELALKSVVVSGVTLLLLELLKRRSAAQRSWLAHVGLAALLLLPAGSLIFPSWRVNGPHGVEPSDVAGSGSTGGASVAPESAPFIQPVDWQMLLQVAYAVGAGLLLLLTVVSVLRLFALRGRSAVLVDANWLTALAQAQRRMGVKYGAALLVNDEIKSPLSWGMLRPTILLNEKVVPLHGDAEAIIAHELAHVIRMDWAKLLASRVATALFWFNPLVWVLARQCHQLREEAADDAVLRSDVPSEDYAALLIGAAKHECRGALLAAHGVAPGRGSLKQRVARVLDEERPRVPAAAAWAACCLTGAALFAGPLSALTLEREVAAKPVEGQPKAEQFASLDHPLSESAPMAKATAAIDTIDRIPRAAHGVKDVGLDQSSSRVADISVAAMTAPTNPGPSLAAVPAPNLSNPAKPAIAPREDDETPSEREYAKAGYPGLIWLQREVLYGSEVTPEYMSELAAAGYPKLTTKQLISFKTVGITGDYIRRVQKPGERRMTPDELLLSIGD